MKPYRNISTNSGVIAYSIGRNSITIQFIDGATYLYTYQSAGKEHVQHMKKAAEAGKGLSTYISQHVKDKYAEKLT